MGVDVPDHTLFDDVTQFLGIKKVYHRLEPFKPIVELDGSFDLVTAFQVSFNGYDRDRSWEEPEWTFFLEDIFKNVLNKDGEIVLEMNYDPVHGCWLSAGARRAFKRYKARIFGRRIHVKRRTLMAS